MAAIQATTATTLNPPPYRREAAGKNTRWNGKLPELLPTLLSLEDTQKSRAMMYLSEAKCGNLELLSVQFRPAQEAIACVTP